MYQVVVAISENPTSASAHSCHSVRTFVSLSLWCEYVQIIGVNWVIDKISNKNVRDLGSQGTRLDFSEKTENHEQLWCLVNTIISIDDVRTVQG